MYPFSGEHSCVFPKYLTLCLQGSFTSSLTPGCVWSRASLETDQCIEWTSVPVLCETLSGPFSLWPSPASAPWFRELVSKNHTSHSDLLTDIWVYQASGRYWWKTRGKSLEKLEVSLPSALSALDCSSWGAALAEGFQFPPIGHDSRFWWLHCPFVPSCAES